MQRSMFSLNCVAVFFVPAGVLYTHLSIIQIGKKVHKETDLVILCQNFLKSPSPSHYIRSSTPGANTSRLGHALCASLPSAGRFLCFPEFLCSTSGKSMFCRLYVPLGRTI